MHLTVSSAKWRPFSLGLNLLKKMWPSDAIWRHRSGSTLAQVMAGCLTAPSHYLKQCWLIISYADWHSSGGNFAKDTSATNHWNQLENYFSQISFKSPRGQWVKMSFGQISYIATTTGYEFFYLCCRACHAADFSGYRGKMGPCQYQMSWMFWNANSRNPFQMLTVQGLWSMSTLLQSQTASISQIYNHVRPVSLEIVRMFLRLEPLDNSFLYAMLSYGVAQWQMTCADLTVFE